MRMQSADSAIKIQSSNIELGEALTQHCRQNIEQTCSKLFGRLHVADVHFRRDGPMIACTVRIKVGALRPWAGEISHHNPYRAFNNALHKVAVQMRRTKAELREDHGKRLDRDLGIILREDPIRGGPLLAPNDDGKPDPDDFTRAQTQAHRQTVRSIGAARDILTLGARTATIAAE